MTPQGKQINIEHTAVNYTASSSQLEDHLSGIDTELGNAVALSDTAPSNVTKAAASAGVATEASRRDHKHDISTATPSSVGTANAEGSSTSLARADHVHDASALLPRDGSRTMTGALDMNNQHVDDIATAHYNSWPGLTPSGGAVDVVFDSYQAATVTLNAATVTAELQTPRGPGAYKLLIVQDGSGSRALTLTTEGTEDVYAPNGSLGIATAANAITLLGLIYDGSDWYVVASQPMQVVT